MIGLAGGKEVRRGGSDLARVGGKRGEQGYEGRGEGMLELGAPARAEHERPEAVHAVSCLGERARSVGLSDTRAGTRKVGGRTEWDNSEGGRLSQPRTCVSQRSKHE